MDYKFLIYISYSYSIPIGKPLEQELLRLGHSVRWFADQDEGKEKLLAEQGALHTIDEAVAYRPHIVLTATDSVAHFLSGIKVQIFHGFPANKRKGTDQFRIRGFFDLYCTQGPSSTVPFKKQQKKYPHFEVVETGWSKVDPLFPIENNETEKPTILIASTFTKDYSIALKDEVIEELVRLSKLDKWKFNIVLHPKLDPAVHAKIKALQNENFVYHDTTDLIPLFKKANILFADTTSAIIEFLLQHKLVVTFRNNMPGPYLIDVTEVSDIEKEITRALTNPPELIKHIEEFAAFSHPYHDGQSSRRVIDATIAFLHSDKSHLKKKPYNFIRKYKMRKRLQYHGPVFQHDTIIDSLDQK